MPGRKRAAALSMLVIAMTSGCGPMTPGASSRVTNSITGVAIFYGADGRPWKSHDVNPLGPMPMHIRLDTLEPNGTHGMDVTKGSPYPTQAETWINPYEWHLVWEPGYLSKAEIHAQVEYALPGQSIECHFEDIHGEPIPRSAHPQAYDEDDNAGKGGRLDVFCAYSPSR